MSEDWLKTYMFCPCCGNEHLTKLDNNLPVADMRCEKCGETFELKSKQGGFGKKINDGSYQTMIKRLTSLTNPQLFVLSYSKELRVTGLTLIPKFFFVPDFIEKRNPLAEGARRAGWTGCNILYYKIPIQGKINIIHDGVIRPAEEVVRSYEAVKSLEMRSIEKRGWLMDVLSCVNTIAENDFSLKDVYAFGSELQSKHPNNRNIEAKIRQQLQLLRDKNVIKFLGNGKYKKIL